VFFSVGGVLSEAVSVSGGVVVFSSTSVVGFSSDVGSVGFCVSVSSWGLGLV